jgi:dephospho-CoA kinase
MKQRIKVIGITGGIASGKSTIAKMLESLGASVINADKICHRLINTKSISHKITNRWGDHIQDKYGRI